MLYLNEIVDTMGEHLKQCLNIEKSIGLIAKRVYRDGDIIFVNNDMELLPSNECELDGFHFITKKTPKYEGFSCYDQISEYIIDGFTILYGFKDCHTDWQGELCNCISSFIGRGDGYESFAQITGVSDDIPSIINEHFPHVKSQFKDAQPCTTLIKIGLKIQINIC